MRPDKTSHLSGIFAPTITGYHFDGSISPEGTRQFVRFLLNSGVRRPDPAGQCRRTRRFDHRGTKVLAGGNRESRMPARCQSTPAQGTTEQKPRLS